jgi:hypothetical protein
MPGFRKGAIPPQIMPRIKYAAIEQLCSQTCEAALEEEGIQMMEGQTELSTSNSLEFPGFDVDDVPGTNPQKYSIWRSEHARALTFSDFSSGYCKASNWKPGKIFLNVLNIVTSYRNILGH